MVETKIVKTIKLNILPLTSKKEQMLSEIEKIKNFILKL